MRVRNLITGHWIHPVFDEKTQSWGEYDFSKATLALPYHAPSNDRVISNLR